MDEYIHASKEASALTNDEHEYAIRLQEKMLGYVVEKMTDEKGQEIPLGHKPHNVLSIIGNNMQEFLELINVLVDYNIIGDMKKKAKVEVVYIQQPSKE